MDLCIDQGNSSTKVGMFENDNLVEFLSFKDFTINIADELIEKYNIENCIICSVTKREEALLAHLEAKSNVFIELSHHTLIPITNNYKTPETLGKDRLAAIIGASYLKPNSDVLVVDAGTAITYDFADADLNYWGGNISPGIDLRLRSLHEFTQKLPAVEPKPTDQLLGNDTESAILSGVIQGIVFEMNGYMDTIKIKYPQLSIFLTGGSAFYFDTMLKNTIFVEKNLVLIGINRILQYNVQK